MQERLARELAERKQTEQLLKSELERARKEAADQEHNRRRQSVSEREQLKIKVQLLEERLKEESSERQKLEGNEIIVPYLECTQACLLTLLQAYSIP